MALAIQFIASSCEGTKVQNVKLENAADSLSYAIGVNIGESFKEQKLTEVDAEIMAAVINAIINNDTAGMKMTSDQSITFIQGYMSKKQEMEAQKTIEEGKKLLEENAKRSGVTVTPSGLQYEVIKSGTGASPVDGDRVTVHYRGTFINGEEFDSSIGGEPATFNMNQVVIGWQEALKLMKVGDKWNVWLPSDIAYGPNGYMGVIPPNATLIFELELLDVQHNP